MAFTVEFLYENGKLVKALDNESLDKENTEVIFGLKLHDIIALGNGADKQAYRILRIKRDSPTAEYSRQNEDNIHIDYIVEAI